MPIRLSPLLLTVLLTSLLSCSSIVNTSHSPINAVAIELLAQRFRSDFAAHLNADSGWAAAENAPAKLYFDQPFRLRVQTRALANQIEGHILTLQYRKNGEHWLPIGVSNFPYPRLATPSVAIVSTRAYQHGDETERLLGDMRIEWDEGFAINLAASTPVFRGGSEALEWEWPLVVRRFADGPSFNEDGTVIEFRLVDGLGRPVDGRAPAVAEFEAAPGHLGGTFIESPGRIGPYQSESGELYFFMEPTETDNRFMAMRSEDFGRSWREVSGHNRPAADDLEGVATARFGDTIHIVHQVSEEVFYHAFDMAGGVWITDSESIATHAEPPTQFAALAARSDGSLVAMYAGEQRVFLQIRDSNGVWGRAAVVDADIEPALSGPVVEVLENDLVVIAYTALDGRGFVRHLLPDDSLSPRLLLSNRMGVHETENGAILPIAALPAGDSAIVYREQDGLLYERRLNADTQLSRAVRVSDIPVVTGAVDSDQVGADLISAGDSLHLLFIDAASRSIYYTHSARSGQWSVPKVVVSGIEASWVRGSLHFDSNKQPIYGFVYDAGSQGGAGMNRYASLSLQ